jgi:putative cardiolipin synthase
MSLCPIPSMSGARRFAVTMRTALIWLSLLVVAGCATVPSYGPRLPSYAIADPGTTMLGRTFAGIVAEHPGQSGFLVHDRGPDALVARLALARAAERTLDLQYYIAERGITTDLLLQSLGEAAQRGVRVRLLLDDIHGPNRTFAAEAVAAYPRIEVRLFNPFLIGGAQSAGRLLEFMASGERLNRRMHNKLWIADNTAGLIGGRNLADEYFDAAPDVNFADLDLLAVGPVVQQLSQGFDEYWNSGSAVPFEALGDAAPSPEDSAWVRFELAERLAAAETTDYRQRLAAGDGGHPAMDADLPLTWGTAYAAYDDPDKQETAITSGMQHLLPQIRAVPAGTRSELLVMSPYFIPSAEGREHLGDMVRRGLRVAVVTNSLASTDALAAHAGYARHRADLLRRGIELFELRPEPGAQHSMQHRWRGTASAALHAKLVIVDRARVLLGSMNLDPRSRLHNTESWVGIESPELASRLAALFDENARPEHSFRLVLQNEQPGRDAMAWVTEEQGQQIRYEYEPKAPPWVAFWRSVLSLIVPEHML